jgi:hypothetical protein
MPAAFEMSAGQFPTSDAQRLFMRHFAIRVTRALSLEQPSGFNLAAQLCGAANWEALPGAAPPISPDQPLHTVAKVMKQCLYPQRLADDCPVSSKP